MPKRSTVEHNLTGTLGEVADVMIQVESDLHRAGWDTSPPAVHRVDHIVGHLAGGYQISTAVFGVRGLAPRDELHQLATIAETLHFAETQRLRYPNPPICHLMTMECWINRAYPSRAEYEADPRPLADVEGSEEVRYCFALVGESAEPLILERIRKKPPKLHGAGHGDLINKGGAIYEMFRQIHLATLRIYRTPAPTVSISFHTLTCPHCGYELSEQDHVGMPGVTLTAGATVMCLQCGEPARAAAGLDGLQLQTPTAAELAEIYAHPDMQALREAKREHPDSLIAALHATREKIADNILRGQQ